MIITPEQLEILEKFFANVEIPIVMKLNRATTLSNVPAFVRQVLENLKRSDIAEAALRPRLADLEDIKRLVEKGGTEIDFK